MEEKNEDTRGKVFRFPDHVDSSYNVINGVPAKWFWTIVVPFAALALLVIVTPPYSVWLFIGRLLIGISIFFIGLGIVMIKPVRERMNISLLQWMQFRKQYIHRQKRFYIRGRKD